MENGKNNVFTSAQKLYISIHVLLAWAHWGIYRKSGDTTFLSTVPADTFNGMFLLVGKQKMAHVASRRVRVAGLGQVK